MLEFIYLHLSRSLLLQVCIYRESPRTDTIVVGYTIRSVLLLAISEFVNLVSLSLTPSLLLAFFSYVAFQLIHFYLHYRYLRFLNKRQQIIINYFAIFV